ncbi:MAG: hypothetical protein ACREAC_00870, partial [Blastocatellia bacterium]
LQDSWDKYQGYYIFIDVQLTDPALFAEIAQTFFSNQVAGTRFAWISNPNDISLDAITVVVDSDQTTKLVQTFNFRNDIVVMGQGCPITLDTNGNQFEFSQPVSDPNRIALQVDFGNTTLTGAVGPALYLPLCGNQSGCLRLQLTVGEEDLGGNRLDAALRYFVDDPDGPFPGQLMSQRYPILSLTESGVATQISLTANLDPLDAFNTDRSYFSFTESPGGGASASSSPVGSYFRTKAGAQVTLTPLQSGRFVFAPNSSTLEPSDTDPLYLVPLGDFTLGTANGSESSSAKSNGNDATNGSASASEGSRLMAGFGGNEYFDLLDSTGAGNVIHFVPGQDAYVPGIGSAQNGSSNGNGPGSAKSSLQGNATTSWAVVIPAAADITYYAQPQTS